MTRRYYLAAVFERDTDHERWNTEPIGAEELTYTYRDRVYNNPTTAKRAQYGAWGDFIATDATMDSKNLEEYRGYYLGDVVVVEE